jgi:microcystin degradation protein MlrC
MTNDRRTPRVFVGGLFHETHCFLPGQTAWEDFSVLEGPSLWRARGESSPLGGVLDFAAEHSWEVVPGIMANAMPGPIVQDRVWERLWERWEALARPAFQQDLDAVYLVLHGACVTESYRDLEGELLQRLRALPGAGSVPIFGVFDLHANFSPAMAERSACLVAYRENPHRDARESATRAAALLERAFRAGRMPRQYSLRAPLIWPPPGTGSDQEPMKSLLAMARRLEKEQADFWAVNVIAGFAFSDTPDTGVSFSIVTDGPADRAEQALEQLVDEAMRNAQAGCVRESSLDEVMQELRRQADEGELDGLAVIAEPSDNIGGGAPGDGTGLLRGLVEYQIPRAAVCLCDPESVQRLQGLATGQCLELRLGGKGSELDVGPYSLECTLLRCGEGRFELEDKCSHLASMTGDWFDMGPCAVVQHQGLTILLTSQRTPPMDLGQWHHMGVAVEKLFAVGVKAAVAHRQAYDPIARQHWSVSTAGPCQSDPRRFAYRWVNRPSYPLDSLAACHDWRDSFSGRGCPRK